MASRKNKFDNNKLALLLIGAILFSVVGTMVSLNKLDGTSVTGAAVDDLGEDMDDDIHFTEEELAEMTEDEIAELEELGYLD